MAASSAPVFKEERKYGGHKATVYGVAISPNGILVASAGDDGKFILVEISSGTQLYTFAHTTHFYGVSWSPDGTRLWVSAHDGSVFEVSRGAGGGQWSHKKVYKNTTSVNMLTYVPTFNLLALPCDDNCLVLMDVKTYKVIQTPPLGAFAWCVVCNASGSLLFVGCGDGLLCALSRNVSGTYDKVSEVKEHEDTTFALSLSASGSLLLAGSEDQTASLWRIASPFSSFDASPLMTFLGHEYSIHGAAFSGDEQFAITSSYDNTIRIWRIADGAEVGIIPYEKCINGLSFHAASGALAAGIDDCGVVLFRCAPQAPVLPSIDRRKRRPLAAAELPIIQERIAAFDESVRATARKEGELLAEIARLKDCVTSAEKELALLRSADYVKKRDELALLYSAKEALLSEISACDHVLFELDENTKMPNCLGYLHSEGFEQWLHDIGLGDRLPLLGSLDGQQLKSLSVRDVEDLGLSFAESSTLLLRAYMTHHRLSPAPHFVPPNCLLSWDAEATSSWLSGLGAPFASLCSLGLTGPCLRSLIYARVRALLDAAAFARFEDMVRDQLVSEGAPQWAQSWSALAIIGR